MGDWRSVTTRFTLARKAGHSVAEATRLASFGTGLLSIGTCLGCLAVPVLAGVGPPT